MNVDEDGPPVGGELPVEVGLLAPELTTGRVPVILLSATCSPCREIADKLDGDRVEPGTVALVAGRPELADGVANLLPSHVRVLRDPCATQVAQLVQISSTPFGLLLDGGRVVRKGYLHTADDFAVLCGSHYNKDLQQIEGKTLAHVS